MPSYNSTTIVGRLGRDPEMRYTASGKAVTSFSVAVDRAFGKSADGDAKPETDWFKVTAWERLAETCNQYLTKGQAVLIEGRVGVDQYTGRDGKEYVQLTLTANQMRMLSSKPTDESRPSAERHAAPADDDINDDDLPF